MAVARPAEAAAAEEEVVVAGSSAQLTAAQRVMPPGGPRPRHEPGGWAVAHVGPIDKVGFLLVAHKSVCSGGEAGGGGGGGRRRRPRGDGCSEVRRETSRAPHFLRFFFVFFLARVRLRRTDKGHVFSFAFSSPSEATASTASTWNFAESFFPMHLARPRKQKEKRLLIMATRMEMVNNRIEI